MSCPTPDPLGRPTLTDAVRMAQFGNPVRAIEAFNRGVKAAADAGLTDEPLDPGEYELALIDGRRVHVTIMDHLDDAG